MLKPWQFILLTTLGALSVLLAVTNAVYFTRNRAAQAEVNSRQQFVQQSVALESLYRDIAKALAELAVKNNDTQLLQMLAAQGVNVSVNTTPAAPAPPAAAAPAPKR
jgi:hypothetical protein